MKENLKTTTYRNGTAIPNVTDENAWINLTTGAYVWYDNNISWKDLYGALYNWFATVDTNGLCPTGWHVPTDYEWTSLTDFIGGTGEPHGNELKSCRQDNSPLGGGCNQASHHDGMKIHFTGIMAQMITAFQVFRAACVASKVTSAKLAITGTGCLLRSTY